MARAYVAIDLKSFYASVECVERGLDPLTTNLVVADASRTEKTICLAISPSLKAYGLPGRARLFEVVEKARAVNAQRQRNAPNRRLNGSSCQAQELCAHAELALDYIVATPRMALYVEYSTRIFEIYTRYVAPEDIHVYSIDEVFMDVTQYLRTYGLTPRELAMRMIRDVHHVTGITATAGIGTNLYLCKVAMDIVAKRMPANEDGVRIAELDESSYRRQLWAHRPLTDFWRVGRGYAAKLEAHGLYTMGDVARCSLGGLNDYPNAALLYKLFGINAELLIDHAWGWEPCTLTAIKAYKPQTNSLSSGQVLSCPYPFDKGRMIVREMIEQLVLELVDKRLVTDQVGLMIGYDIENLADPTRRITYHGPVTSDFFGRDVPKQAHGNVNLAEATSSTRRILDAALGLYDRIVDPKLLVRRLCVVANRLTEEGKVEASAEQLDMFTDYAEKRRRQEAEAAWLAKEKRQQQAVLEIKRKFGKNAILKGMDLQEGATAMERNRQIGGHRA